MEVLLTIKSFQLGSNDQLTYTYQNINNAINNSSIKITDNLGGNSTNHLYSDAFLLTNNSSVNSLEDFYYYQTLIKIFVFILFIYYPFRLFLTFSWSKNFPFLSNLLNVIERILSPFIMISFGFFFILYFSSHMLMQTYLQDELVEQGNL
jgi:hypothetical protein